MLVAALSGRWNNNMFDDIRAVIRRIPRGKVSTYGEVARAAGHPGCARQVVWALRNAKGLPWHRVLGAGGVIRLPGEQGLEQRIRLETEGVRFLNGKADLQTHQHRFRAPTSRSDSPPTGLSRL